MKNLIVNLVANLYVTFLLLFKAKKPKVVEPKDELIHSDGDYKIIKVVLMDTLERVGNEMRNCMRSGNTRFSYLTFGDFYTITYKDQAKVLIFKGEGKDYVNVHEIKGRFNKAPKDKYHPYINFLLSSLNCHIRFVDIDSKMMTFASEIGFALNYSLENSIQAEIEQMIEEELQHMNLADPVYDNDTESVVMEIDLENLSQRIDDYLSRPQIHRDIEDLIAQDAVNVVLDGYEDEES